MVGDQVRAAADPHADSAALLAELAEAKAERDELTKALTGLTCGGSEFFAGKRRDGSYRADIPYCVEYVQRLRRDAHHRTVKAICERQQAEGELRLARAAIAKAETK